MGVALYFIIIFVGNVNLAFGAPPIKTVFVKNEGQWSKEVLFRSIDGGIVLKRGSIEIGPVILRFDGQPDKIIGSDPGNGTISYFIGNDPSRWKKAVPFYREVIYEGIYDGIDLIIRGMDEAHFNLQWRIHPGGNPQVIKLLVRKGKVRKLGEELSIGGLLLGEVRAYQGTEEIDVNYRVKNNVITFDVGEYDRSKELLIDPSVVIGGLGNNADVRNMKLFGNEIYVVLNDVLDSLKVDGVVENSLREKSAVVLRLDKNDFSILSGAVLGGSDDEEVRALEVSSQGVYIAGNTRSTDYPVTSGAYNENYSGGVYDAFITRLSLDLSSVLSSTYIGGSGNDDVTDMIITSSSLYFLGFTWSSDFPVTSGAYDTEHNGKSDVVVGIMSPDLSTLFASTFLGGSLSDYTYSMACF